MRRRLEKHEQADTQRLLLALGAAVYVLGTRRPGGRPCPTCGTVVPESQGTRQTAGLPDLLAFLPGRPHQVLAVEQKRPGGRLSPAQESFRALCEDSRLEYVTGSIDAVIRWLQARGYVRPARGPAAWRSRGTWEGEE